MDIADLPHAPITAFLYFGCVYSLCFGFSLALLRIPWIASAVTAEPGRFECIDGLRGILAVGVMCHHSFTAMTYFRSGEWKWSTSPVLNHLGDSTVGIFFLITAFLFTRKVCRNEVNWSALYRARILRLAPLYFLVVLYVLIASFVLSDWLLREPVQSILSEALQWFCFVIFGRPDINGLSDTWHLIAGVNWSLAYEWQFYLFAVPAIHFTYRISGARGVLTAAIAVFCLCRFYGAFYNPPPGRTLFYSYFAAGCIVALIADHPNLSALLRSKPVKAICASAILALGFYQHDNGTLQIIVATLFFLAVVSNFSLFGLLSSRPAIWLGDISYGIYLIHGAVLFWAFRTAGAERLALVSVANLVVLTCSLGIVVISAASLSYLFIELPALDIARQRRFSPL
jgi:peptidoglycan/LPS O-acetylase OafA/YrhL